MATEPDLVVLDLGLPDIDGIDVCRQLRRWSRSPIIVLSADGAEDRKVAALDVGADDYVTKPFSMPELMARLRVALRHRELLASGDRSGGGHGRRHGGRHRGQDGRRRRPTRRPHPQGVRAARAPARNPGKVVTHGAILGRVWGAEGGSAETLRVHVASLRKKLGDGPDRPRIQADPGVGYRLTLRAAESS